MKQVMENVLILVVMVSLICLSLTLSFRVKELEVRVGDLESRLEDTQQVQAYLQATVRVNLSILKKMVEDTTSTDILLMGLDDGVTFWPNDL